MFCCFFWRGKLSNTYCDQDYAKYQGNTSIKGFDVLHQLFRLRYSKNMVDSEALAIMSNLADGVKAYDQVVEVSAY
jgi:hypothetical protein